MAGIFTDKRKNQNAKSVSVRYRLSAFPNQLRSARLEIPEDELVTSYRTRDNVSWEEQEKAFTSIYVNGFTSFSSQFDKGNEFYSLKHEEQSFLRTYKWGNENTPGTPFFNGNLWFRGSTSGNDPEYSAIPKMSVNDIKYYGNQAINRVRPSKSQANLTQFLGETLLEGIPLYMRSVDSFKAAMRTYGDKSLVGVGSGYLAVSFGLLPIIRDLQKVLRALLDNHKILEQYYRDSGHVVRRRYDFHEKMETLNFGSRSFVMFSDGASPFGDDYALPQNNFTQRSKERMWFTGAFQYWAPRRPKSMENLSILADQAQLLLCADITPEVVWNVAPWSWLVDYYVGIGDAISIASATNVNSLVVRYGYLMRYKRIINTYKYQQATYNGKPIGNVERRLVTTSRERYKATPYGFGINPDTLNAGQIANLAALALSRSRT